MATITRSFEAINADGSLTSASVTTGTDGETVDMSSYVGVHGTVEADFPGSPTDDLVIEFRGRVDGTNWDDSPFHTMRLSNDTDPNQKSYAFEGNVPIEFRLHCYRSGSTDTITVTHEYKRFEYDAT